jgi:prohibitin 1
LQNALPFVTRAALGVGIVGVACLCVSEAVYVVDGGERALIFDKWKGGTRDLVRKPGLNFLIPFVQYPIIFDVRSTPFNLKTETGSKDLQKVMITLRLLYRPDEDRLPYIYQRLGIDYSSKVLNSVGNEVLKAVVAQYDANELISRRETISQQIRSRLVTRAGSFGLRLDDVAITHLTFSKDFVSAIEHKQVAGQLAERAKFLVLKAEQEKKAKIIMAEGEAEAAELIGQAMKSGPGYLTLRRIEAARDIAEELATSRNVIYLPSGVNVLMGMGTQGTA